MAHRLKSANTVSARVTLNLRSTEALFRVNDALLAATQDVFAEIVFAAAENSPVLDKATSERYPGENRESINSHVTAVKKGVKAKLFTTSGFGGFIELGTKKMKAEPYLYPAFEEHIVTLPDAVKARLEELVSSGPGDIQTDLEQNDDGTIE
jgi:hypothetical protein